MSKTTLDVADLFSVLDFAGVQKRLQALNGVSEAEMTAASSSSGTGDRRFRIAFSFAGEMRGGASH